MKCAALKSFFSFKTVTLQGFGYFLSFNEFPSETVTLQIETFNVKSFYFLMQNHFSFKTVTLQYSGYF